MSKFSPGNSCHRFGGLSLMFCLLCLLFYYDRYNGVCLKHLPWARHCDSSRNTVLNK